MTNGGNAKLERRGLVSLWKTRRWALFELVLDAKMKEANRQCSETDGDEEAIYRSRLREVREITVSRHNTVDFLMARYPAPVAVAMQVRQGKTHWFKVGL